MRESHGCCPLTMSHNLTQDTTLPPILSLSKPPNLSLSHPLHPFQCIETPQNDAFFLFSANEEYSTQRYQMQHSAQTPKMISHTLLATHESVFSIDAAIQSSQKPQNHLLLWKMLDLYVKLQSESKKRKSEEKARKITSKSTKGVMSHGAPGPIMFSGRQNVQLSKHLVHEMVFDVKKNAMRVSAMRGCEYVEYEEEGTVQVSVEASDASATAAPSRKRKREDTSNATASIVTSQKVAKRGLRALLLLNDHTVHVVTDDENRRSWSIQEAINAINESHWEEDFELLTPMGKRVYESIKSPFEVHGGTKYIMAPVVKATTTTTTNDATEDTPASTSKSKKKKSTEKKSKSSIESGVPPTKDFIREVVSLYIKDAPHPITEDRPDKTLSKEEVTLFKKSFLKVWERLKCPDDKALRDSIQNKVRQALRVCMRTKKLPPGVDAEPPRKKRKVEEEEEKSAAEDAQTKSKKKVDAPKTKTSNAKPSNSEDSPSITPKKSKPTPTPSEAMQRSFLSTLLRQSLHTVSCVDIMHVEGTNQYLIAVGFEYGSFYVLSSDLKDSDSELKELHRYIEPHDGLDMGISKLVWISKTILLMARTDGSVSVVNINQSQDSLQVNTTMSTLHPANHFPILDLMYVKGLDRKFIVVVSSLVVVVYHFQEDINASECRTFVAPDCISSVQVCPFPVQDDYIAYVALGGMIIEWNMSTRTRNETQMVELPGDFAHPQTEVHGLLLSPNGVLIYALLQKQNSENVDLIPLPLLSANYLPQYLTQYGQYMRGTDDLFHFCYCVQKANPMLQLGDALRDYEKWNAHLCRIIYRLSPLICPEKQESIFHLAMYHVAVYQLEHLAPKNSNRVLFCDWLLLFFKQNPTSRLITQKILTTMQQVYTDFNQEECLMGVHYLLNIADDRYIDTEDQLKELKAFVLPKREEQRCTICDTVFPASIAPFNQLMAPCGHRVLLDIATLRPLQETSFWWCDVCNTASTEEMRMCRLCGHEHCSKE